MIIIVSDRWEREREIWTDLRENEQETERITTVKLVIQLLTNFEIVIFYFSSSCVCVQCSTIQCTPCASMHAHNFYILPIRDGFVQQQWKKTMTVTERRLVRYNLLIASINLTYGQTKCSQSQSNKYWLHAMHFSPSPSLFQHRTFYICIDYDSCWLLVLTVLNNLRFWLVWTALVRFVLFRSLLLRPFLFQSLMYTLHALVLYKLCSVSKKKKE